MTDRSSPFSAGTLKLAVLQVAPVFLDAWGTWDKLKAMGLDAVRDGAEVLTWGETLIPGYPEWVAVDTTEAQEPVYARYWDQAVTMDGALIAEIKAFAKRHGVMIIGGVAEREGGSVYATIITIDAQGTLIGRHRKLKPTWRERLVWADGDGLGLRTHPTKVGKIGSLNCWENWLPLARAALHQQDEFIHVGVWPGSDTQVNEITRFVAMEGKSWSVAACGMLGAQDMAHLDADVFPVGKALLAVKDVWQNGGSQIVAPDGSVVAGPLVGEEGIITADIDTKSVVMARQLRDPSGHYARPDVLDLSIRGPNHAPLKTD
ncbi:MULTISPECIES: carbon-nitrogen hydrolase family protein [Roseobacteraceae]|uniref:carbon-nitrogen hydrolase family protein n=1 Tax=Roseobacteraceae TaxID=2854170 RepID=UPI0032974503